jgi:phosphoglycerate dehydrogenase-like enzyme
MLAEETRPGESAIGLGVEDSPASPCAFARELVEVEGMNTMRKPVTTFSVLFVLLIAAASGQTERKKIVISGLGDPIIAELRKSAPPNVLIVATTPNQLAAEIGDADAVITPLLTREQFRAAKRLKWVQILNAGVEESLPVLKGTDITLTSLKVTLGPEVADHAMALLLSLTRGLYQTIPARKWAVPRNIGQVTELRGKTAVIVGVGGVGTQIADRAAAFGMTIIGVDPKDSPPPSSIKQMVKPMQMDSVLPLADAVFVTAPETEATKGMFGATQFRAMKKGAYFIIVSRGTLYSMDALVEALASRHLAGAGLDVTDPEPLPDTHPIWRFYNVVITPHIAGASDAALTRVLDLLLENIRRFSVNQALMNVIDKDKGY